MGGIWDARVPKGCGSEASVSPSSAPFICPSRVGLNPSAARRVVGPPAPSRAQEHTYTISGTIGPRLPPKIEDTKS